jgi:hypothetical protein
MRNRGSPVPARAVSAGSIGFSGEGDFQMAQMKSVTFHRRAVMALDAFSPQDRARIEDAVHLLQAPGNQALLQAKTAKLAIPEPTYVMRATPSIRLIYRETADGFEVMDVVLKATLETFRNQASKRAAPEKAVGSAKASPAKKAKAVAKSAPKKPAATPNGRS